ncbi:MAG: tRNA methyltransferase, partial [Alphaproteobacteria bacterium]|nr:tRNA methyltransferase [Alphaproteobacteria bacterium]
PQNAGTMIRMAACLKIGIDVIEPCGFIFDDKRLRRAGMDYLARAAITRHNSWEAFVTTRRAENGRLILLTTRAPTVYSDFAFEPADTLIVGRESAGVPDHVHDAVDAALRIPMAAGERSLNVALSAAMVIGEALRQTGRFP